MSNHGALILKSFEFQELLYENESSYSVNFLCDTYIKMKATGEEQAGTLCRAISILVFVNIIEMEIEEFNHTGKSNHQQKPVTKLIKQAYNENFTERIYILRNTVILMESIPSENQNTHIVFTLESFC